MPTTMPSMPLVLALLALAGAGVSCTPQAGVPADLPGEAPADSDGGTVVAGTVVEDLDVWDPQENGGVEKPFALSPETLDFRAALTEQTLVIRYYGSGDAAYSVVSNADWASVDRPNGIVVGGWVWLYVTIDRSQLPAGTHTAEMDVRVGDFGAQTVTLAARVSASGDDEPAPGDPSDDDAVLPGAGDLRVSAERLDFGAASESLDFVVRNAGAGEFTYSVTSNADWLTLSVSSGVNSGAYDAITAYANRSGLDPGGYSGVITVEASSGDRFEISALLLVSEPGAAAPAELTLAPSVIDLGESSVSGSFEVSNAGSGALGYTVTSQTAWLSADPTSGTVGAERDAIQVAIDRAALSPGQHLGIIRIQSDSGQRRDAFVIASKPAAPPPPPAPGDPNEPPVIADDPAQILTWLKALPPLPKVHYSSALPGVYVSSAFDPLIIEYVRLTHAACFKGEGAVNTNSAAFYVKRIVELCKTVDAIDPTLGTQIGITYSPYHQVWPHNQPPTYSGPERQQEIDLFVDRMTNSRNFVAQANAQLGTNYQVGCIILDTEVFLRKEPGETGAAAWNAAMDALYNAFYDQCKAIFPNARVEWNGRGDVGECFEGVGWCESRYFTLNERGDMYSAGLYRLPELLSMRESYRRTVELALANGVDKVSATVALANGFVRDIDGFTFTFDWDYDLIYSWQIGAELNHPSFALDPDRFAPWDRADIVVFYPQPFGTAPHWSKHFVAYVRGAALIRELPE